jgi:hypothetical protein
MDSNIDIAEAMTQAYPAMVVSPLILSLTKLEVFMAKEVGPQGKIGSTVTISSVGFYYCSWTELRCLQIGL